MIGDELHSMLKAIERRDPDGGDVEPTDADYAAHELWATAAFGPEVWEIYNNGAWAAPDSY